jgi:hypothetical protein
MSTIRIVKGQDKVIEAHAGTIREQSRFSTMATAINSRVAAKRATEALFGDFPEAVDLVHEGTLSHRTCNLSEFKGLGPYDMCYTIKSLSNGRNSRKEVS